MDEEKDVFEIVADTVIVEVKDKDGQVFRRELPIDFYENSNFLKLSGENFDGSTSTLVFFTPKGAQKAKDIMGMGADHDSCGTH